MIKKDFLGIFKDEIFMKIWKKEHKKSKNFTKDENLIINFRKGFSDENFLLLGD